ncbi:MAG: 6-carboxytetrahydropterin synthase [candidate division WOR-3 bacterium]|nr:6-carboxytetrahydropterin synthase [candidate division WOR-3 bacterium]MCX7947367.1 6-carboxytetrahydropterin synthase [candidate division WOR-3 bacterium]MDW8150077.1 6-carboxytetrahydropterin synthase [candidate division WOR-3 bacterium]
MYKLIAKVKFSSAHFLRSYKGKPEEIHGHNYVLEVHIKSESLNEEEITYDFLEVEEYIKSIVPDRKFLNKVYNFNPTCENLAKFFFNQIKKRYPNVEKVILWETENFAIEYSE